MRLSQRIKNGFLLWIFFGSVSFASAQKTFKYEAFLNRIDSTGFYKIILLPDIVSKSNDDLSDVRLMDQKGNYVPYVSEGNLPNVEKQKFVVFPQVLIDLPKDTGTSFIAENTGKQPVSTLWVKLKNTAVTRSVNLSGSDDLKNWYAIEEDIPLQDAVLTNDASYLQSISFPASNYHYLKLLVNDKSKTPVKFLEAGEYITKSTFPFYYPVSYGSFTKKDTNKTTWITIQLKDNYMVNRLVLSVSNPAYYKREVSVYRVDPQGRHLITLADLSSSKNGDIFISAKTRNLALQINNGDNPPLTINDVKVFQVEHYIVSYLEKGTQYKLFTGNVNAKAPEYDLKFFADSIRNIQEIGVGPLVRNGSYISHSAKTKYDFTFVIWAAIIVALLMLSLLTWKMMNEVNSKKISR